MGKRKNKQKPVEIPQEDEDDYVFNVGIILLYKSCSYRRRLRRKRLKRLSARKSPMEGSQSRSSSSLAMSSVNGTAPSYAYMLYYLDSPFTE